MRHRSHPWFPLLVSLLLAVLAGCSGPDAGPRPPAITGSLTYRQRIALPPTALIEVQLLDVTRPDAPAEVLHAVTLSPQHQPPFYFTIRYDPRRIDPTHAYALKATVTVGGQLRFLSTNNTRVLTQGHPAHRDLVLEMAPGK
ncbi:MAG TPA: YbaY family lipoprotein [Opitutaceae bacterium]|nr:YbaY family lipoprotein [Opitutaceae bacterium]